MKLLDCINILHEVDRDATIYSRKPWTENSPSIVELEPQGGGLPAEAIALGLSYFIEVAIAAEFLDDWAAGLTNPPTVYERCQRLIEYAANDA